MIDRKGFHYGAWTVLKFAGFRKGHAMWLCRCEKCGRQRAVSNANLTGHCTNGCNECAKKERKEAGARFHANYLASLPPGYRQWQRIKPDAVRRWQVFANFIEDMGPPLPGERLAKLHVGQLHGPNNTVWQVPVASLPKWILRKLEGKHRNEAIRAIVANYHINQAALARKLGISRERVRQIAE